MEGPGGYQFVGRTTQVWNHRHPEKSGPFEDGTPWLLRFFDRISWYPVEPEELMDLRSDVAAGRGGGIDITDGTFSLADHERFLSAHTDSIREFRAGQTVAFAAERQRWSAAGNSRQWGEEGPTRQSPPKSDRTPSAASVACTSAAISASATGAELGDCNAKPLARVTVL